MQMVEVARLSERCHSGNADNVQSEVLLQQISALLAIVYVCLAIWFFRLAQQEASQRHSMTDVHVAFYLELPHVDPIKPAEPEQVSDLDKLLGRHAGSEAAPKPLPAPKDAPAAVKADHKSASHSMQASPVEAQKETPVLPTIKQPVDAHSKDTEVVQAQAPTAVSAPTVAAAENQQATSGTTVAGGAAAGDATGNGTGRQGAGGTGKGQGDLGAGAGVGPSGGALVAVAPRLGNIAPYRKDLLLRLAQNWHPKLKSESLIVMVTLDHQGKVLADEVFHSSGDAKADDEALGAIASTEFAPLPDWYRGDHLQFKINMDKVEQLQLSR